LIQVEQRLWPQCMNCFGLQGSAVKNGIHLITYHTVFKKFHLAPAVAYLLMQDDWVNDHLDSVLDPVIDGIETAVERLETKFKRNLLSK
jgi:hypothetical protein